MTARQSSRGVSTMKSVLLAAVAIAISTAAFAKDLKGTVMTDSEMDKVTAGAIPDGAGLGLQTAGTAGAVNGLEAIITHAGNAHSSGTPGFGICTAGRPTC